MTTSTKMAQDTGKLTGVITAAKIRLEEHLAHHRERMHEATVELFLDMISGLDQALEDTKITPVFGIVQDVRDELVAKYMDGWEIVVRPEYAPPTLRSSHARNPFAPQPWPALYVPRNLGDLMPWVMIDTESRWADHQVEAKPTTAQFPGVGS